MEISKKKNERIKHPAWMCVYGSNIFSFNRVAIDSLDIINTEADGVMFAYDRSDIYVGACKDEDAYFGQFQKDNSFRFGAAACMKDTSCTGLRLKKIIKFVHYDTNKASTK